MIGPRGLQNAQEKGGRKEGREGEGSNCVNSPLCNAGRWIKIGATKPP